MTVTTARSNFRKAPAINGVRYKLAILTVLADQPGGRATRDEVRRLAGLAISGLDPIELKRFTSLGDIDIFQHGLVARDDDGLQITEAGSQLLAWLGGTDESSLDGAEAISAGAFKPGKEAWGYIDHNPDPADPANDREAPSAQQRAGARAAEFRPQRRVVDSDQTRRFEVDRRIQKLFGSLRSFLSTKRSIQNSTSQLSRTGSIKSTGGSQRSVRAIAGAALGLCALLFVVAGILAAIAFGQIQSLKSDVAVLRRELLPLRERLAKFEAESQKWEEQQEEAQNRSEAEKKKADGEVSNEPAPLNLTREETQLIRDYIKPALTPGIAAPEINVGDRVSGATIPLPSPLTEKIPKLQGARFTTRNGSIIIVRRNSRQADTILGPN